MPANERKIAQVIEKRKNKLGIPWSEVARRCGIDEATIHRLRADASAWNPQLSTLEAIADGLGIRMRDFWGAK
jgi:transcriptional regulator with XRE-family HTH domain